MTTIEIRQRRDDVHAQIKGMPTHWGCGDTELTAIGDLAKSHSKYFTLGDGVAERIKELSNEDVGILIKLLPINFGVNLVYVKTN